MISGYNKHHLSTVYLIILKKNLALHSFLDLISQIFVSGAWNNRGNHTKTYITCAKVVHSSRSRSPLSKCVNRCLWNSIPSELKNLKVHRTQIIHFQNRCFLSLCGHNNSARRYCGSDCNFWKLRSRGVKGYWLERLF